MKSKFHLFSKLSKPFSEASSNLSVAEQVAQTQKGLLQEFQKKPLEEKVLTALTLGNLWVEGVVSAFSTPYVGRRRAYNKEERQIKEALVRMKRKNLVKKISKRGKPYLILTEEGTETVLKEVPLAVLRFKNWDRIWRIAVYDIPETKRYLRDLFREKFKSLGWGQYQLSVLVTPLPVHQEAYEFIESQKLEQFISVLEAKNIAGKKGWEIARQAWNLDQLEELYTVLIGQFHEIEREFKNDSQKFAQEMTLWKQEFLALVDADPFLPYELLPPGWPFDDAFKIFQSNIV